MTGLIRELDERATRLNAALCIYSGADHVLSVNQHHKALYPFIDFTSPQSYNDIVLGCAEHRKIDDRSLYESPHRWLGITAHFRRLNRFSQTLTRHMDGRIIQVTYERLDGADGCWYQMRRDVTSGVLELIRRSRNPLALAGWDQTAVPPVQSTFLVRLLDALPLPAALITTRCQVIDGNATFSAILFRGDGLAMVDGRLCLRCSGQAQRAFASHVSEARRRRLRSPIILRVPRPSLRPPYLLTLSEPQTDPLGWDSKSQGILLVTVADPDRIPSVSPRTIAALLQITEDDARLALDLSRGLSLGEIAAEHGKDPGDLSGQLNSILVKTGNSNKTDMIRQITTLSYVFGPKG